MDQSSKTKDISQLRNILDRNSQIKYTARFSKTKALTGDELNNIGRVENE